MGCDFDMNNIDNFSCKFTVDNSLEMNVMFDACHMIKLARSALANKKCFKSDNRVIGILVI